MFMREEYIWYFSPIGRTANLYGNRRITKSLHKSVQLFWSICFVHHSSIFIELHSLLILWIFLILECSSNFMASWSHSSFLVCYFNLYGGHMLNQNIVCAKWFLTCSLWDPVGDTTKKANSWLQTFEGRPTWRPSYFGLHPRTLGFPRLASLARRYDLLRSTDRP